MSKQKQNLYKHAEPGTLPHRLPYEDRVKWFIKTWSTASSFPSIYLNQQIDLTRMVKDDSDDGKKFLGFLQFLKSQNITAPDPEEHEELAQELMESYEFGNTLDAQVTEKKKPTKFGQLKDQNGKIHPDWITINDTLCPIDDALLPWADGTLFGEKQPINWKQDLGYHSLWPFINCIEKYITKPAPDGSGLWQNRFAKEFFIIEDKPKPIVRLSELRRKTRLADVYVDFKKALIVMNKKLSPIYRCQDIDKLFK